MDTSSNEMVNCSMEGVILTALENIMIHGPVKVECSQHGVKLPIILPSDFD